MTGKKEVKPTFVKQIEPKDVLDSSGILVSVEGHRHKRHLVAGLTRVRLSLVNDPSSDPVEFEAEVSSINYRNNGSARVYFCLELKESVPAVEMTMEQLLRLASNQLGKRIKIVP